MTVGIIKTRPPKADLSEWWTPQYPSEFEGQARMSTLRDNIKEKKSPFPNEILQSSLADQNDEGMGLFTRLPAGRVCRQAGKAGNLLRAVKSAN